VSNVKDWPTADKDMLFRYLGWNSYCSERYKLLYVATPKVACTSLKWWFAELEGCAQALRQVTESIESDPDLIIHDNFYKVAPKVNGLTSEALLEPVVSDEYRKFAVVRNPYKRVFSAWQSKLLLREPLQIKPYVNCEFFNKKIEKSSDVAEAFEGFLDHLAANEAPNFWDVHWAPQVSLLRPDLIQYSKLVRIENAKDLSAALADWIGPGFVDPFAIRSTNESLIPYLPELFTARSVELIRTLYARDFETFGYSDKLPEAKDRFTDDQIAVSLKAIEIIRKRHQRIGDMSNQISNLKSALVDRDTEITILQKGMVDRDAEIDILQKGMAEREADIGALHASLSWQLTRPFRFLEKLVRSGK
jgi:hypothetical protein